jgi:hypothetical protein
MAPGDGARSGDAPRGMTNSAVNTVVLRLRETWARLHLHARALALRLGSARRRERNPEFADLLRSPWGRRLGKWIIGFAAVGAILGLACGAVWWRLGSGPLSFDIATPWLSSALQDRLGGRYRVEVGGTVLERDDDGRTALRLRDIVVRDADHTVVASAPKAEVGIASGSLLTGTPRAERLSLIGAEMAVRIERDGQLTVFAGNSARPIATADPAAERGRTRPTMADAGAARSAEASAAEPNLFAALLGWIQDLDAAGLDGRDLIEIGLKSGTVAVDDQRSGKLFTFANINLSLTRPKEGGVALALNSMGTDGPWSLNATITPRAEGRRAVDAVFRDISPKDVLLALRLGSGEFQTDVPVSAAIRAEIDRDGMPHMLEGRIVVGAGYIGDARDQDSRILIDEAQMELRWDAANRRLLLPVDIHLGASRIRLYSQVEPPRERGGTWSFAIVQGSALLASLDRTQAPPLMLDRVNVRAKFDPAKQRLDLEQADLRGVAAGAALSGMIDFSGDEPLVAFGIAGSRMAVPAFKRLWPALVASPVRAWVEENVTAGSIERLDIATRAPLAALRPKSPFHPNEMISVDIESRGTSLRPLPGLPLIRDADVVVRATARTAVVTVARGTMELPSGRKLTLSNGTFEVADTKVPEPLARTRFRVEGSAEAAAELIAMDALRDAATVPLEPAGVRGSVSAQVTVTHPLKKDLPKGAVQYTVDADLSGFSAEKFVRGQKAEAATLRVTANQNLIQIKGDMRIAGTPAAVDFRKLQGDSDAEVRIQTTLDDAARARMGLDVGPALTGPVPVKLSGRTKITERESRLTIEADLTQAKVTDLLPGWNKPGGRPARASFVLSDKGQNTRLDDFVIDGSGAQVKGSLELDAQGEVVSAIFPTFVLSDGDKASLRAERSSDGTLKVALRGDVLDGRGFVREQFAGQKPDPKPRQSATDLDLEIKLGTVPGHHGEALRSLDLKLSRRAGQIRSFAMNGKLGQNATITGDMRARGGRQVLYVETNDAGAFFRFNDIYPRIVGGGMSVAMDPPTADHAAQEGLLNIQDFAVRGETALDRVAAPGPTPDMYDRSGGRAYAAVSSGVQFSRLRVEFTRSPGRLMMREGVVRGPTIGGTVEGHLDYARDEVRLRGTFVPAYALNNMFGQIPIVGLLLGGGSNEGLLGVTYQVVGSPQAPVLQVNPMSAVAPGFLRKIFDFPAGAGAEDRSWRPPESVR